MGPGGRLFFTAAALQVLLAGTSPFLIVEQQGESILQRTIAATETVQAAILAEWGQEYREKLFEGQLRLFNGGSFIIRKLLRAVVLQQPFVMSFTGTSVTAGHDNVVEDAYPAVVDGWLRRVFAHTGVAFEARNGAVGNNPTTPYSYCVEHFAGADADVVTWEMSMMVDGYRSPATHIEAFVRTALCLPRRPAVLILGKISVQEDPCGSRQGERRMGRYLGRSSAADGAGLLEAYGAMGLHGLDPEFLVLNSTCGDTRYMPEHLIDADKPGPHKSPNHPGPHGHALVGAMIAMHYAALLLEALRILDDWLPGVSVADIADPGTQDAALMALGLLKREEQKEKEAELGRRVVPQELPEPVLCRDWDMCRWAGAFRCATSFAPDNGAAATDLLSLVSEREIGGRTPGTEPPCRDRCGSWWVVRNEAPVSFGWVSAAYKTLLLWLRQVLHPEGGSTYPVDHKWILIGYRSSGPLRLRFHVSGLGAGGGASGIGVCRAQFLQRAQFENSSDVLFYLDDDPSPLQVAPFDHPGPLAGSGGASEGQQCVWVAQGKAVGGGWHVLRVEPQRDAPALPVAVAWLLYPA